MPRGCHEGCARDRRRQTRQERKCPRSASLAGETFVALPSRQSPLDESGTSSRSRSGLPPPRWHSRFRIPSTLLLITLSLHQLAFTSAYPHGLYLPPNHKLAHGKPVVTLRVTSKFTNKHRPNATRAAKSSLSVTPALVISRSRSLRLRQGEYTGSKARAEQG